MTGLSVMEIYMEHKWF